MTVDLRARTPRTRSAPTRSTSSGFLLLALCVGSLQWMLERGERYDWFDSRFVTVLGVDGARCRSSR